MKFVGLVSVVALVVGCEGGGLFGGQPESHLPRAWVAAVAPRGDAASIRAAFGKLDWVGDGGLFFTDPICRARFAKPRNVKQVELDGFAQCLAKLAWRPTPRTSAHYDAAIVTTTDGFELELHLADGKLDFVGFTARVEGMPETPMITPVALEALRTAGEPHPTLPPATLGPAPVGVPLRICLDATGEISTVAPASARVEPGEDAFIAAIADWKFKPFTVGGQPIAACAIVVLRSPPNDPTIADRIPIPATLDDHGKVVQRVAPGMIEASRISGQKAIVPTDIDKTRIGIGNRITGSFELCLDAHGVPTTVTTIEPTGLASYDQRIISIMKTWRYRPYEIDHQPTDVCTTVRFIYSQSAARGRR